MTHSVLDILIYIFEHYVDDELEIDSDQDRLRARLRDAGFEGGQVTKALDWLQALAATRDGEANVIIEQTTSVRSYTREEAARLDTGCRGFLLYLEQSGVLDPASRELVIDRIMALEDDEIDLAQLKWIVLMVLFNQPGQEQAFVWMENVVMDDAYTSLH